MRVCQSVGGDRFELEGRGTGVRSPRVSRCGASFTAPLTMDLRGVGMCLGRSARVAARPWGCAGARTGMAR